MPTAAMPANILVGGLLLACCLSAVGSQAVYRCGPKGNQYSQLPCESGTAIDVADPRSPQQMVDARKAAAAQQKLADQMANERRTNGRASRPPLAGGIDFRVASAAQAPPSGAKPRKPGAKPRSPKSAAGAGKQEFVAFEPGTTKPKRRRTQD